MFSPSSEQEQISRFCIRDLPLLAIPSDYESSTDTATPPPQSPSSSFTFTTPISPPPATPTGLGESFSEFGISSQASTDSETSKPKGHSRRKRVHSGYYKKGANVKRKLSFSPSPKKRELVQLTKPKSRLFDDVSFPRKPERFSIQCRKDDNVQYRDLYVPQGSQVMDMSILGKVFNLLKCTTNNCPGHLALYEYGFREGMQSYLLLKCIRCHQIIAEFPNSIPSGSTPAQALNDPHMLTHKKSEVNYRAILAAHTTSSSWTDFVQKCHILGIQNSWRDLPRNYLRNFIAATADIFGRSMSLAANKVRSFSPISNIPDCGNCSVSFDGSWHTRGHYSNQGFCAAIEIDTGLVLDYQLYERVCNKCIRWTEEKKAEHTEDYEEFWARHQSECPANFKGSSQSMESAGALEIWARSISKNQLAYTTYIGDGDSSSFKRLSESNPYDSLKLVRKEECLGHTQKRLKGQLKKPSTKQLVSKPIGPTKLERVAHFYGLVIVQNRGKSPEEIQKALYVLADHLVENHDNCPHTRDSWCYMGKNIAEVKDDDTIAPVNLRAPYLTEPELARLLYVYQKFASIALCSAVTLGKTQNANESLHSVLWHNAPKIKRVGQKSLQASAALAVTTFNEGSMSLASVLTTLGVSCSHKTLLYFARKDKERNRCRIKAVSDTQKRRRRILQSQFLSAESSRRRREKAGSKYKSKAFGSEASSSTPVQKPVPTESSGDESDTICEQCKLRNCPIGRKRKIDDWVFCEFCGQWYHVRYMKVTLKELGEDPFRCYDCEEQDT